MVQALKLETFTRKLKKKAEEIGQIESEKIAKNAIDITRKEIKKKKYGRPYKVGGLRGVFRRSRIGQAIAVEPAYYRAKYNKGASTYDSLSSDVQRKPTRNWGTKTFFINITDSSPRSIYKYEYLQNGKKKWINNIFELSKGRNKEGYLRKGRTGTGFGLYNAYKQYKKKGLSDESINLIRKWY